MAVTITARAPSKMYKHHVANLRELERAIVQTARLAKAEIAGRDPQKSLRSMLRLYSFLLGAWAECRLRKLLHEQYGFTNDERGEILAVDTQLGQWQRTVDLAFRKHHQIPKADLDSRVLGVSHAARRDALHSVLSGELKIIIEIRNKLAHGQWVYPFNNEGTAVESEKYLLINKENFQSLQFKYALLGHLADAAHDLVVSPTTFQRDFDGHFRRLEQVRTNISVKKYVDYESALVGSRQKRRKSHGRLKISLRKSRFVARRNLIRL
ncbi:hypothetical protein [Xanthomonas cannabis]|uniref:hypothetical protein n=2 Tax=Xanthomonas cannabis TaxID=1885674 RepID=UPI001F2C275A|nr:hypothetical protein [Xanthomonas cannabis]MCC8442849.1 hypothetical protein [Xanthomonas cannabis]